MTMMMTRAIATVLLGLAALWPGGSARAQNIADVGTIFARVNPSVVVIRARGREVTTGGLVGFTEIGSGLLVSADGTVMHPHRRGPRWPANSVYRAMPLAEFLQTNATINTGDSGGPMFNMKGEVIGIVSHNISKAAAAKGWGSS